MIGTSTKSLAAADIRPSARMWHFPSALMVAVAMVALVSPKSARADLWTYTGQTSEAFDTIDSQQGTLTETITYDTVAATESATAAWFDSGGTVNFVMAAQSPTSPLTLTSTTASGALAALGLGADTVGLDVTGDITTTPATLVTTQEFAPFLDTAGGGTLFDYEEAVTLTGVDTPSTPAPEPASLALLLSGLFGLRMIRRRRG